MNLSKIKLIILLVIHFMIFGCSENITGPEDESLPELKDSIPFEYLGSGKIVFKRIGPNGGQYSGFYVIDIDQRDSWALDMGNSASPCVSPSGQRLTFTKYSGDIETAFDVHVSDIYGSSVKNITKYPGQDRHPAWNQKGNRVIFWVDGMRSKLLVASVYSQSITQLRTFQFVEGSPANYIPSGRMSTSNNDKVIYVSNFRSEKELTGGLYQMNLDGTGFEVLVYAPAKTLFESPRFSPDENTIAYISLTFNQLGESGYMKICLLEFGETIPSVIYESDIQGKMWSHPGGYPIGIAWSPDGRKLLFNKPVADFTSYLYVINIDGTELTQVTSLEGVSDIDVSWSRR